MKQLQIDIKEGSTGCTVETLTCNSMDAVTSHTILYDVKHKEIKFTVREYLIPAKIDHWNLENGVITIYYQSGFYIEITRIYA